MLWVKSKSRNSKLRSSSTAVNWVWWTPKIQHSFKEQHGSTLAYTQCSKWSKTVQKAKWLRVRNAEHWLLKINNFILCFVILNPENNLCFVQFGNNSFYSVSCSNPLNPVRIWVFTTLHTRWAPLFYTPFTINFPKQYRWISYFTLFLRKRPNFEM